MEYAETNNVLVEFEFFLGKCTVGAVLG
jgi:hypothetical protein